MEGNHTLKTKKTLGPDSAELLLRLSAGGKTIFSLGEAQAFTDKSYEAMAALLSQLVRKGWLVRLVPGKYLIVPLEAGLERIPMADRYVIAREVLAPLPYYISHYSALELHQMTTQPVNRVYATVPRRRTSRIIAGVEYRFVYASQRSFWGGEAIWATGREQVDVSDLGKTVLDCAVRPELCGGLSELAKGLWLRKDALDEGQLVAYVQRLDHKAAAKRIGFLLDTFGLGRPETIAALHALVNVRYALLDPTLPDKGPYRARWRLRINLDPEELKAIVWT
jgi:predicted transcriptional regulator of viral defense system